MLTEIAAKEGVRLPSVDTLDFLDQVVRLSTRDRFIRRMAEQSVSEVTDSLWQTVTTLVSGRVPRPNSMLSTRHLRDFRLGIPAHQPECLGDVVNAGWAYYRELQGLKSQDHIASRTDYLNEMILKTVEVLEYSRRILR